MKIFKTANYKKLSKTKIEEQLSMGIKIEQEHTDDVEIAGKIAIDHLQEDPEYYTKLKKMEDTPKPKLILKNKKAEKDINIIAKKKKKEWDPNPWAVCHTTVDKDKDPDKFERCVLKVKKEQK